MRLFILQQLIKTFPWESVWMLFVFGCVYPACFSTRPDISDAEDVFVLNVARQVIIYLENMKFQAEEMFLSLWWIQTLPYC